MTERERFQQWVRFGSVDRPVRWEWAFRDDVTKAWRQQGLPADVPVSRSWAEQFGLDRGAPFVGETGIRTAVGVDLGLLPLFDSEVLARDEQTVTIRDGWGTVARHAKDGSSMPQFLAFGVRDRTDFRRFQERLDPTDPRRYPADWEARKTAWQAREFPLRIHADGWYGFSRRLLGPEQLSFAFYDDPALVEAMAEFWGDFLIQGLDRATAEVSVDYVLFWEDLAYKNGPLLSPAHFRRFFLPHYQRVIEFLRGRGIEQSMVDSDGNVDAITPLWLEAGITILGPYEVAAGMDVARVRRQHPRLVLVGGIDKREIAKGRQAMEAELQRRVLPLLEGGGYIPTLDHATIPEMALADYANYRELLHRLHQA